MTKFNRDNEGSNIPIESQFIFNFKYELYFTLETKTVMRITWQSRRVFDTALIFKWQRSATDWKNHGTFCEILDDNYCCFPSSFRSNRRQNHLMKGNVFCCTWCVVYCSYGTISLSAGQVTKESFFRVE